MGLVSLVVIVWLLLKRCRTGIGILASVIFLVCFSDDVFVLVQFTKIASITMAAGGFLFLEGIYEKRIGRKRIAVLLFGGLLLILGIYAICWQQIIKRIPLTLAYANKAVTVFWGMIRGMHFFSEIITVKK